MRPDDNELAQLLNEKFIPVRIVNFKGVDMNLFQFDYDLTFAVLMMNANGYTYSRFGTMDATQTTHRMSIAGLKKAMRGVLALHQQEQTKAPPTRPRFTLDDMPSYRRNRVAQEECAHCHYANNFRIKEWRAAGKFTKDMLFQYPLPENIGITLDVDNNNVVKAVLPHSPAQRAGVQAGDVIVRANESLVFTAADLQFVLNAVPDEGKVSLQVSRGGKVQPPMTLPLPKGWRKTDISWRPSQADIPPTVGVWMEPLDAAQKKQRGIAPDRMALRVTFLFRGEEWVKTRGDLQMNDVIIGINGEQLPHMNARQFHAHFRLRFNVGDTVTLNVLRGNQRINVKVPCLDVGSTL
ncbi:MAG: PDZ domain-containing protein [Abditibacteriales bacterium]|nr:PDZ domain-containing protein [Abditibacteriales bacterium]